MYESYLVCPVNNHVDHLPNNKWRIFCLLEKLWHNYRFHVLQNNVESVNVIFLNYLVNAQRQSRYLMIVEAQQWVKLTECSSSMNKRVYDLLTLCRLIWGLIKQWSRIVNLIWRNVKNGPTARKRSLSPTFFLHQVFLATFSDPER